MKFSTSHPILLDRSHRDPYRQTFELAVIAEANGFDPLTFLAAVVG